MSRPCKWCSSTEHTQFYCKQKPIKPIKRSPLKAPSPKPATKTAPVKKKKTESRGQLVKKLDSAFSQYVRLRGSVNGLAACVTCERIAPWKEMQAGHFFTRGRYSTRWDEDNVQTQCVACNVFLKGNYINYTRYMIDRYGREFVDSLEKKSLTPVKIPTNEIRDGIELYKMKVRQLQ